MSRRPVLPFTGGCSCGAIRSATNAECHAIGPSDFATLAMKWRAMWPELFPK
jgi:hypothetical protein